MNFKTVSLSICALSAFSVCFSLIFGAGTLFKPIRQHAPLSASAPIVKAMPTTEPTTEVIIPDSSQANAEMSAPQLAPPQVSVPNASRLLTDMLAVPQQIGTTPDSFTNQVSAPAQSAMQLATFVGIWAPDASSCSLRSFRDGLLPTVINQEGASAGETFCSFKNQQEVQGGWRMDALCSNKQEQWSTRVHLSVSGDRLIWRSKRGSQAYARCANDVRMAQAH